MCLSRLRPVSGANYIAPTCLADGEASLDPLRSVTKKRVRQKYYNVTTPPYHVGAKSVDFWPAAARLQVRPVLHVLHVSRTDYTRTVLSCQHIGPGLDCTTCGD